MARKRITHRIRANQRVSLPVRIMAFDTETREGASGPGWSTQHLWFGWAAYTRRRPERGEQWSDPQWVRFTTPDGFWNFLEQHVHSEECLYVFAHNLNFDAAMIELDRMSRILGWELIRYAYSDHLMFVSLRKGRKSVQFIDTLNYARLPLEKVGQHLGLPKLPMPSPDAPPEAWDTYCRRDVEIVLRFVQALITTIQERGWGSFAPTLPRIAYNTWRHRYMKNPPLVLADDRITSLERAAYCGGRTECFRLGEYRGRFYKLDINSSYPYCMREFPYPVTKIASGPGLSLKEWGRLRERYLIVAECWIETDQPLYPKRTRDHLLFPVGRFITTLTTPELDMAFQRGHLKQIGRYALYEGDYLFREYVEDLYRLRLEAKARGDETEEFMAKLMLNSLYGKFAQRGDQWEVCEEVDASLFPGYIAECSRCPTPTEHIFLFGKTLHRRKEEEAFESIPSIAAHVTAYGRIHLLGMIERAGWAHVYYCDTDSLFVDHVGYERLKDFVHPQALGMLKLEGEADRLVLYGLKDYIFGGELKRKGIRKGAKEIGEGVFEQIQFRSYPVSLRKVGEGAILIEKVIKHMRRNYEKGRVTAGGRVLPLRLNEW